MKYELLNKSLKLILKLLSIYLIFRSIYLISTMFFQDVYILEWTSRNNYLYFWLIALIWILFDKYIVALSIAVGHLVGLFFALYLDELRIHYILLYHNIADLTDLSIKLRSPKGDYTWFYTILLFMVIGINYNNPFSKPMNPH